jgi:hypothetical protein
MPIRINLLAEQQAAEEMRRRDPVKKSLWLCGGAVALMLLWSLHLQLQSVQAKEEMNRLEARWKKVEPEYETILQSLNEIGLIHKHLEALQKFATNRFFWTEPLNALQFCLVDDIRVMRLEGSQVFSEVKAASVTTNLTFALPQPSWWKVWASPPQTNVSDRVNRVLNTLTNHPNFAGHNPQVTVNLSTNPARVSARIAVQKKEAVSEKITLRMAARDYHETAGRQVDRFYRVFTNSAYFKPFFAGTNSTVRPESIQPRLDATDVINPGSMFIEFTLEARYPERIRAHE